MIVPTCGLLNDLIRPRDRQYYTEAEEHCFGDTSISSCGLFDVREFGKYVYAENAPTIEFARAQTPRIRILVTAHDSVDGINVTIFRELAARSEYNAALGARLVGLSTRYFANRTRTSHEAATSGH